MTPPGMTQGILDFRPERLSAARVEVEKAHPTIAELTTRVGADRVERLRAILGLVDSPETAARVAAALPLAERAQVARNLGMWTEAEEAAVWVLEARPDPAFAAPLWRALEAFPERPAIWRRLADVTGRFGGDAVGRAGLPKPAAAWFSAPEPIDGILRWSGSRGMLPEELPSQLPDLFTPDAPLLRFLFTRILTHGTGHQLLSIGVERLLEAWSELDPSQHVLAAANYLNAVSVAGWEERVLVAVRRSFGMPGLPESLSRMWDSVAEDRIVAFRKHFIAADLARVFAGDTERHAYWLRWGDRGKILEVETGLVRGIEWALLRFSGFSVIEFFEVGNAAYFMPPSEVDRIRWGRATHERDLKRRLDPDDVPGYGDNRLLHHDRWQVRANRMMTAWMQRYE